MRKKLYWFTILITVVLMSTSCGKGTSLAKDKDSKVLPFADSIDGYLNLNAIYPRYNQNTTVDDEDIWMFSYNIYSDDITETDYENIAALQYEQSEVKNAGEKEYHKFEGKFSFIFFDRDTDTVLDKFMAQGGERLDKSDSDIYLEADQKYDELYIDGTESKPAPGDKK